MEYKRDGVIFRAHYNYRSNGPCYDWLNMVYEDDEGNEHLYPSKILCFVMVSNTVGHVVYTTSAGHGMTIEHSVLSNRWKPHTKNNGQLVIHSADLSCMERPILVVETEKFLYEIIEKEKWGDRF